ncbi:MAG: hypothetical protein HY369_01495 [Candidatus Aenigmarchaeota archaeon]|nr:hypothetical protein [Candidatus Aenigmarchaeota archaeon]
MSNSVVIDHCTFTGKIQEAMSADDFKEAVMARAGQIVASVLKGDNGSKPHKLAGVEVVAASIARSVIEGGAGAICRDMDVSLVQLRELARSTHISFC